MRNFSNEVASFYCIEGILPSIKKLCRLIKEYPIVLTPFPGDE